MLCGVGAVDRIIKSILLRGFMYQEHVLGGDQPMSGARINHRFYTIFEFQYLLQIGVQCM